MVLEQDTFILAYVLVQPRKTRPCLTERLLMGRKESNQTIHVVELHVAMVCRVMFQISLYLSDLVGINSTSSSISSIPYTNIPRHNHHGDREWDQYTCIYINPIQDTKDQLFLLQDFGL